MERETGENVFFHDFPLFCVCPAFAGSGQRSLHFLHTVLSLWLLLFSIIRMSTLNQYQQHDHYQWGENSRREQAMCKTASEEALKSNGTLCIDFFLPLLLKHRASENFSRSLFKPLALRPGEVNLNHPSQVFIQLCQNFQWRRLYRGGFFW